MDAHPPAISPIAQHAPEESLLARWLRYFTDHVAPGTLCVLVGLANLQTAYVAGMGQGVALDLDPNARAWLAVNKAGTAAFFLLVAYLFTVRAPRRGPRAGPLGVLVALAGTFAFSFQGLLPPVEPSPERTIPSFVIGIIAMLLAIIALLSLGRFFGVFPEARGLVRHGPYRYVRHPLYLAEIIASVGIVLPILSVWSVGLFIAFVALQYWRAILEERALTAAIPEYAEYARHTWRIIPGIH
jgi:protein-S-isoprenylcysteine O-methyltransferase Ste14